MTALGRPLSAVRQTPSALLDADCYQRIAIQLKGGAWRRTSLCMLAVELSRALKEANGHSADDGQARSRCERAHDWIHACWTDMRPSCCQPRATTADVSFEVRVTEASQRLVHTAVGQSSSASRAVEMHGSSRRSAFRTSRSEHGSGNQLSQGPGSGRQWVARQVGLDSPTTRSPRAQLDQAHASL